MPNQQPVITDAKSSRQFACSAVGIQSIIVNQDQKVLLLSSPTRNRDGTWQVVSGALEAGETILAGVLRETREEVGNLRVRPLGTVHAETYKYDENIPHIIGIYYLLAYEGGEVIPGDDMQGSQFRWWTMDEIENEDIKLRVPPGKKWILRRAVELYLLWKDQNVTLQHVLSDITQR